ncbi:MAG: GIY-YIG nuclease family protein [Nevskia sp.]|nr:GIY-YIG nuclease family protein [Nevskia sp.]
MNKEPCVYILVSGRNGTLYIGVSSQLQRRLWQHRDGAVAAFSTKYQTHRLVWFERCDDMLAAITREKQLKKWNRMWKLRLIEEQNPEWRDLAVDLGFSAVDGDADDKTGFPPARE